MEIKLTTLAYGLLTNHCPTANVLARFVTENAYKFYSKQKSESVTRGHLGMVGFVWRGYRVFEWGFALSYRVLFRR